MRRSDKAAARFAVAAFAFVLVAAVLYFTGWAAVAKNVVVLGWREIERPPPRLPAWALIPLALAIQ